MKRRARALVLIMMTPALYAGASLAVDDVASDVSAEADLTAVIALQGYPCGEVVEATRQRDNDYIASCQDGNRYRVYVNADGRVVVEKQ